MCMHAQGTLGIMAVPPCPPNPPHPPFSMLCVMGPPPPACDEQLSTPCTWCVCVCVSGGGGATVSDQQSFNKRSPSLQRAPCHYSTHHHNGPSLQRAPHLQQTTNTQTHKVLQISLANQSGQPAGTLHPCTLLASATLKPTTTTTICNQFTGHGWLVG